MIHLQDLAPLPLRVYEQMIRREDEGLTPFLWAQTFLKAINDEPNQVILHIWPMEETVILGMLDRQLPFLEKAKEVIRDAGYQPVVRNIGGLAVVADSGVLNFSLVLPDTFTEKLGIAEVYLLMVDLIRDMFFDFDERIVYREIEQSYCPGNYDLSIASQKFAGIAQRRLKKGIVVSIYLSVHGNQLKRGQMIKDFYKVGLGEVGSAIHYPDIDPDCMANLSDLLKTPFTVEEVVERLLASLKRAGISTTSWQPNEELKQTFQDLLLKQKQALERKYQE